MKFNNIEYTIYKNYKEGFNKEECENKITDYFEEYDYLLGDWSYGKLRFKGFCKSDNSKLNDINDFRNINNYIKDYCSYDCKYFILEKK